MLFLLECQFVVSVVVQAEEVVEKPVEVEVEVDLLVRCWNTVNQLTLNELNYNNN